MVFEIKIVSILPSYQFFYFFYPDGSGVVLVRPWLNPWSSNPVFFPSTQSSRRSSSAGASAGHGLNPFGPQNLKFDYMK